MCIGDGVRAGCSGAALNSILPGIGMATCSFGGGEFRFSMNHVRLGKGSERTSERGVRAAPAVSCLLVGLPASGVISACHSLL